MVNNQSFWVDENAGNGTVLSLTAGNNGEVAPAQMPATINDRMLVTITDPKGNVTSFERTKFVAEDGTTAIGVSGGTVDGPGGLELRIPEGALDKAVTLKIEPLVLAPGDPKPDLGTDAGGDPLATVGAALKISSPDQPTFKKEVKLAFPLPEGLPTKPEDAFFYVYRKIELPNGRVAFQALDHAFVEGDPGKQKVVTGSYPFSGYVDSYGQVFITPATGILLAPVTSATAILMWHYDQLMPGKPLAGVISGRVLRPVFTDKVAEPTYEPVAGATVSVMPCQATATLSPPPSSLWIAEI